jgi:hypothetical protein
MSPPTPMMLYAGHVAIGEIRDGGPGKVAAVYITATGRHISLGFHYRDRRAARLAIEAAHSGGPEPPRAA